METETKKKSENRNKSNSNSTPHCRYELESHFLCCGIKRKTWFMDSKQFGTNNGSTHTLQSSIVLVVSRAHAFAYRMFFINHELASKQYALSPICFSCICHCMCVCAYVSNVLVFDSSRKQNIAQVCHDILLFVGTHRHTHPPKTVHRPLSAATFIALFVHYCV